MIPCVYLEKKTSAELGLQSALGGEVVGLLSMLAAITGQGCQRKIMLTFCISQFERSEVVAQNLRVSIVAFTITTTATQIPAVTWPTVALSLVITLACLLIIHFLSVDALLQILHPRVDFRLGLDKSLADVVTDNRKIIYP